MNTTNPFLTNTSQDDELISQMFRTARIFTRTLNDVLSAHGIHNAELAVLRVIQKHCGISQADLIQTLQVEAASISRTLERMEKKHCIRRQPLEKGRGKYIQLTQEGETLCQQLRPAAIQHRQRARGQLTPVQKEALLATLQKREKNLLLK